MYVPTVNDVHGDDDDDDDVWYYYYYYGTYISMPKIFKNATAHGRFGSPAVTERQFEKRIKQLNRSTCYS